MMESVITRDPICGMSVEPSRAAAKREHAGETYYFCSASCAKRFAADPALYAATASPANTTTAQIIASDEPATATSVEYTCPMHPQIVRPGPGSCPICGMALEPRTVIAEEAEHTELIAMTHRFWACVALTIPVLVLGMFDLIPGQPLQHFLTTRAMGWIE